MAEIIHAGGRRPLVTGRSLFDYADELALVVPASCRRTGRCHECVVEVRKGLGSLSPRTPAESFLGDGYRLACQAHVVDASQDVEIAILRRRLRILMPPTGDPLEIDPVVEQVRGRVLRDGEDLGEARERLLGLAVDVGTTTVVLDLVDLLSGHSLRSAAFENPQRFGGSDVINRISYDAAHPGELRQALRKALNYELKRLYETLGIVRQEVVEVVVVGNSTMRDLFFGLDVQPIGRSPFRSPTEEALRRGESESTAVSSLAHELGILVHPRARIYGAPLLASHVGADVAADLVAIGAVDGERDRDGVFMVVDIGTNTEIVIADRDRMLAASSPAGPAFEGGLVRYGMPGSEGAIESVRLYPEGFRYQTIGGVAPEGICGSGLVDLLAELRRGGLMSPEGVFADRAAEIPIVPERGITLSRLDVSHLAQAKASNTAGQEILMRSFGVRPDQVDRVYLAGAFANHIDVDNAIEIGFLAPTPRDRIFRVGNASVRGATALLLSRRKRRAIERLVRDVEHVELERHPAFFDLFVDGCRFARLPE